VVVRYGQRSVEALVELPAETLRATAPRGSPVLWVTVGLLATDGFALQLKLKHADEVRWLPAHTVQLFTGCTVGM